MIDMHERLVSDEIKRLVPVLGKDTAGRLSRAYLLGDEDTRKRIFEMVDALRASIMSDPELRDSVLTEPMPKDIAEDGDIDIGTVTYGNKLIYPMRIKSSSLLTHIAVFGSSGYGKTNISYSMIKELSEKNIPVIVFDFSKRNYKDLLNTELKDKIDIYTLGREVAPLRFNPLKPPEGVDLSQWIKEFATVFDHAYWLLGGGTHIIVKAMDGVWKQSDNPTIKDLKEWVEKYSKQPGTTRERNWISTAQRPLESLCFREISDIFDIDTGMQPSEFFKPGRITILELDALSTNDRTFLIEIILQWMRDWLLVSQEREILKAVIILEEAHHILNREKATKLGSETVMDTLFREVRELGLGIIYVDQHPSLVSFPALGNTSTQIYMNLGLNTRQSSDVMDAANMIGLQNEDIEYLKELPVGRGFMLCRRSAFPKPFTVHFPYFPLKKGFVTDSMIRKHMEDKIMQKKVRTEAGIEVNEADIKEADWKIIETIGYGEGAMTSQIYKNAGMSGSTFNDNATRLEEMDLIGKRESNSGKALYYFLTNQGETLFKQRFKQPIKHYKIDTESMFNMLTIDGWDSEQAGDRIVFKKKGKRLDIIIEDTENRDKIKDDIARATHFICANENIRNIVVQFAAKYASDHGEMAIFTATPDDMKKGKFQAFSF